MIVREWRSRAEPTRADAYPQHFRNRVIAELQAAAGFLGTDLLSRQVDETTIEYTVLSRWESLEAIRNFAGDDITKAVVEPGASSALISFDATVIHHEMVERVLAIG